MIDIEDRNHKPDITALIVYCGCSVLYDLTVFIKNEYGVTPVIDYSGDAVLPGWNIRYKKAGRTLCRAYPRAGYFPVLLVVGQKEKTVVESLLPSLSEDFNRTYSETPEGMGQRWLMINIKEKNAQYDDILRVIRIRYESRK